MRKIKTNELFVFSRYLKSIGIRDDVKSIAMTSNSMEDAASHGFDLLWSILDKATEKDGERGLYEFLAGPFEMSVKQISELDISEFIAMLKELASENDLTSFFKSAGALMK